MACSKGTPKAFAAGDAIHLYSHGQPPHDVIFYQAARLQK